MNQEIEAELELLQSIFCLPGEFELKCKDETGVVISITQHRDGHHDVQLTFEMDKHYPISAPHVSVQCTSLSQRQCEQLKSQLRKEMDELKGQPVVMHIMSYLKDYIDNLNVPVVDHSVVCSQESCNIMETLHTLLLHIDHMRAKRQYVKIITSWCQELDLVGRLLLQGKWIFLILQGKEKDIKAYLNRHKSQCVDLNSSGRSCKERMMKVLFETDLHKLFDCFMVQEFSTQIEFEAFFNKHDMVDIYINYVKMIVKGR